MFFPLYAGIGVVSYVVRHRLRRQWLSVLWFALIICFPLILQGILFLSVAHPHARLMEGLQGNK
jgi:hypothetical protein